VADLAATLRSLALRAYQAVRADGPDDDDLALRELRDLKEAISKLHAELRIRKLDQLIPYVSALGDEVEAKLG
jgi:hypothetical protein